MTEITIKGVDSKKINTFLDFFAEKSVSQEEVGAGVARIALDVAFLDQTEAILEAASSLLEETQRLVVMLELQENTRPYAQELAELKAVTNARRLGAETIRPALRYRRAVADFRPPKAWSKTVSLLAKDLNWFEENARGSYTPTLDYAQFRRFMDTAPSGVFSTADGKAGKTDLITSLETLAQAIRKTMSNEWSRTILLIDRWSAFTHLFRKAGRFYDERSKNLPPKLADLDVFLQEVQDYIDALDRKWRGISSPILEGVVNASAAMAWIKRPDADSQSLGSIGSALVGSRILPPAVVGADYHEEVFNTPTIDRDLTWTTAPPLPAGIRLEVVFDEGWSRCSLVGSVESMGSPWIGRILVLDSDDNQIVGSPEIALPIQAELKIVPSSESLEMQVGDSVDVFFHAECERQTDVEWSVVVDKSSRGINVLYVSEDEDSRGVTFRVIGTDLGDYAFVVQATAAETTGAEVKVTTHVRSDETGKGRDRRGGKQ